MSHSTPNLGTLQIEAADFATEIFVIDDRFSRIKSGIGSLEFKLPAGFYKVRFRSGASQHDQLVEVEGNKICRVEGPNIAFYSAAPIENTQTTHEYHSEPARFYSLRKSGSPANGGSIFIFLREDREGYAFNPEGVTLHSLEGDEIAKIEDGEADFDHRWAALRVELSPGTYSLRVSSVGVGTYEMFLTVCDGWQTQIFLTYEQFWADGIKVSAPSLRRSSVYMSKDSLGFEPDNPGVRLSELARQGLTQGRDVISTALMNHLLRAKFEFPILGLVALHHLMRRPKQDQDLFNKAINNLRNILQEHPDLDILSVATKHDKSYRTLEISKPPLLAASWEMLTKATKRRAGLVQPRSVASNIAHNVVFGGAWLIHHVPEIKSDAPLAVSSIAASEQRFKTLLKVNRSALEDMVYRRESQTIDLSQLEQSIVELIVSNNRYSDITIAREKEPAADAIRKLRNLPAPSYSIAEAVDSLSNKFETYFPDF